MTSPTPDRKVLRISMHDVTPAHLNRLRRAEAVFAQAGVPAVQYLFVPDFHGKARASASVEFIAWCRQPRPFKVEWILHGYYHLEGQWIGEGSEGDSEVARDEARPLNLTEKMKATFLTANEGEFLALSAAEQRRRLRAGLEEFSKVFPGERPRGFIAPAWLFREDVLIPVLREFDLPFTENHQGIFDVPSGAFHPSPVITWATRTWLRRVGSLVVCPALAWKFRAKPDVRLAVHPHDFDHPSTVANIESVLRGLMATRAVVGAA